MASMMHSGHQQYQKSNVTSASPETLVVLLYSELLCCLARAREAATKNDRTAKRKHTAKAVRILTALMASLNMEKGESVALNLAVLYEHVAKKLLRANHDATAEPFEEAIKLLTPLKEAWETIAASHATAAPPSSMAASPSSTAAPPSPRPSMALQFAAVIA